MTSDVGRKQLKVNPDRAPIRSATLLALALLLAALALVYSWSTLRITTDTAGMIDPEVPFRQHGLALERAFPGYKETIVAVVDGDSPEASEEAINALSAAMAAEDATFSKIRVPGGEPFFERNGLLYLDLETLTRLGDRLAEAQPLLAALSAAPDLTGIADFVTLASVESDEGGLPDRLDTLLGRMAEVTEAAIEGRPLHLSWKEQLDLGEHGPSRRRLLIAEPALDYGSLTPAKSAIDTLRGIAADLRIGAGEGGVRLRLTGSAMIEHEELASVRNGALWSGLSATAGVALLLVWGLGSIRLITATLATLFIGLIITAGLATLVIGRLNLISVTFAVLFVGLGVDFGIHLCLRYREEMRRLREHGRALRGALDAISRPLSLSALCAGLGFIAFVPTDYRGLAELGVISAIGMAVAWTASLVVLPAILDLMPIEAPDEAAASPAPRQPWTERFASSILGIAVIAAVSAVPLLPRVTFDFNPLNLKDPDSESVATFLDLERNPDTATNVISVLAADLAAADDIAARLRNVQGIGDVVTLTSLVPTSQPEKLQAIDDMAYFLGTLEPTERPPISDEARLGAFQKLCSALKGAGPVEGSGAHRLLQALEKLPEGAGEPRSKTLKDLERRLTSHLPGLFEKLDLALQAGEITAESLPESLRTDWVNDAGQAKVLARPAIGIQDNRSLERFADAALKAAPEATGTPIVVTEAGRVVVGAFVEASAIAFALITVVLVLVLKRPVDVLLVLAPLALAIVYTGATSVLLGLELNFANVIVLPLLLGLGVSGAIHVVMRRRAEARSESDPGQASTRRAVLFSALTTIASFGSLAISPHLGMASMGLLLTVAILWSLVCTLVILPALFALLEPQRDLPH